MIGPYSPMMPHALHPLAQVLLLAGALLAAPCLSAAQAVQNQLVVISPHWDGIKAETARAFSAWHEKKYGSPVTIRWRETGGGASQILRFILSEYKASPDIGIDVLYGGGVDAFKDLKKAGLLTPYDPPADTLSAIPAQLNGMEIYDPDHTWFGAALSGFGIITNEKAARPPDCPPSTPGAT